MNTEMLEIVKSRKGFVAALDQSGGSSSKTLALYGISEDQYHSEEEKLLLLVLWSIFGLADGITINRELEMYEEENGRIEQQLETTVSNYMQYEATTFKELKDTDVVSLVSLYPELQSDKLVQSQIDLYINNNQKIKELKEKQIAISKFKFYLYFGR